MADATARDAFLTPLRRRLAQPVPANLAHPAPLPSAEAPQITYLGCDPDDLLGSFEANALQAGAVVHRVEGDQVPAQIIAALVETHGVRRAVVSDQPEAVAAGEQLRALGVQVDPATTDSAAAADLGITSATALVAATGSLVLRSSSAGGRAASLLPPAHLCVVPAARLVATPGDILRPLTGHAQLLPANLVFITGPSRTGDIEQLLTIGVHGPAAVHIVVTGGNGDRS